jgi:hypothetical protein
MNIFSHQKRYIWSPKYVVVAKWSPNKDTFDHKFINTIVDSIRSNKSTYAKKHKKKNYKKEEIVETETMLRNNYSNNAVRTLTLTPSPSKRIEVLCNHRENGLVLFGF